MTKLNQILIVALLVQAAIIAMTSMGGEEQRYVRPTKVFADFAIDKVTKIEIDGPKGADTKVDATPIVLAKDQSKWVVPGADNFPCDEAKVKTFLENVQKMTASGAVVSRSTYFNKLEVADDKYQRKVTLTHDGKTLSFLLGSSPSFKKIHLRKVGEDDVVLVGGISQYDVFADAKGWVDPKYVAVNKNEVWALTLKKKDGTRIQLERGVGDVWALVGNPKTPKTTEVDALIRKATQINIERPIGKSAKPEFGLENPDALITLVTGTSTIAGLPPQQTEVRTIKIGTTVSLNETKQVYVKASDQDYIITAPFWAINAILDSKIKDLIEE